MSSNRTKIRLESVLELEIFVKSKSPVQFTFWKKTTRQVLNHQNQFSENSDENK